MFPLENPTAALPFRQRRYAAGKDRSGNRGKPSFLSAPSGNQSIARQDH